MVLRLRRASLIDSTFPTVKAKEIKYWRMSSYVSPPMTIPQLTRSSFSETPFKEVILPKEALSLGYYTGKECNLLTLLWLLVSSKTIKCSSVDEWVWIISELVLNRARVSGERVRGNSCSFPRAHSRPQVHAINVRRLWTFLKRTGWGRSAFLYFLLPETPRVSQIPFSWTLNIF